MNNSKKISPQAILALREALSVIFWKKEDLREFLKLTLDNNPIISTLDWGLTKREIVKELTSRMGSRQNIYFDGLKALLLAVSDFDDFRHLEFFDEDGSKTQKAKEAVSKLRSQTKGYIQLSKDEDDAKKKKN
jgi:hypothetical protein